MIKCYSLKELEELWSKKPGQIWWIHHSDFEYSMDRVRSVLASGLVSSISVLLVCGQEAGRVDEYVNKRVYVLGGLNILAGVASDEEEAFAMASTALDSEEFLLIY